MESSLKQPKQTQKVLFIMLSFPRYVSLHLYPSNIKMLKIPKKLCVGVCVYTYIHTHTPTHTPTPVRFLGTGFLYVAVAALNSNSVG